MGKDDRLKRMEDEFLRQQELKGGPRPHVVSPNIALPGAGGIGSLQMRRKFASDDEVYAPHRDIAHLYPKLCKAALSAFDDPAKFPGWLGQMLREREVTRDDISKAAVCLATALNDFTRKGKEISSAHQALDEAGFFDCRPEAQWAIYARIGEVVLGSFFVGIRDITPLGSAPPNSHTLHEIAEAAHAIGKELMGSTEKAKDDPINI